MSMPIQARVTPSVVRWARERARISHSKVAKKLHTRPEHVESWEQGHAAPTIRQAQQLANTLRIPFGYLFLSSPPKEEMPLPDLRTIANAQVPQPTPEFIDLLNDVLAKQEWYRDFLAAQGAEALEFVGRFSLETNGERVASAIAEALEITEGLRNECSGWEGFLRRLIRNSEAIGILVMRSGVACGNTHRPLSVSEFRGFAISDPIAPLVFINGADSKAAQVFTLAHELAHVWIGASGVSNESLKRPVLNEGITIERFCNAVAAEALVPGAHFLDRWQKRRSAEDNMRDAARYFKVSTLVVLRRGLDLGRIQPQEFRDLYRREETRYKDREAASSGGDYYPTLFARNSRTLTTAAVEAAMEGTLLLRDAAKLLNVNVSAIQKIAEFVAKEG